MTDSMIERVSRELARICGFSAEEDEDFKHDARELLTAMREPTEAMVTAGEVHTDTYYSKDGKFAAGWAAAIDAALEDGH